MLAADRYRQVQRTTMTQGELLLALYDGLFRFLAGAKVCFEQGQHARGRELLGKSHAIISEFYVALDHKVNPELCNNLAGLYDFCLSRISDCNRTADGALIDEVVRVLSPLREAWQQAVPRAVMENKSSSR
jgi:flagellar protein FliS